MPQHLIAEEGPLRGKVLRFDDNDQWIVGRDPDQADMVLDDMAVSRKHVLFLRDEDGICIDDLSHTNPILINDLNIGESHLLHEGDRIKIGNNVFIYSEESIPEELALLEEEAPLTTDQFPEHETLFLEDESGEKPDTLFVEETLKDNTDEHATIFEDIEEPEELPFSLTHETPLILKVISGPNSGAEFGIEKGRIYLIGKDTRKCDIVFNDLSVSREHAKLAVDDDGNMTIEDLDSRNKTLVDSKIIEDTTPISTQDIISLGTTSFLIINKEEEVETIYSPFPSHEHTPTIEEEIVTEKIKEDKEIAPTQKNWREQIIPTKHIVFGGSILVIFLVMFISFFSLFKSHTVQIVEKDATEEIKELLDTYKDVQFSFNPRSESLFLVGHVLTPVEKQELMYNINKLPYIESIEDNIIIDEYVWKNMNNVLMENEAWRGISIHSPSAGRFVMSGYVKSVEDSEKLLDYINVNFPYLDRIENQVVVEDILDEQLASILIENGFAGIRFQVAVGELILTGTYDKEREENFITVLEEFKTIKGIRKIKNLAIAASESLARIDLTKNYQITGYAKYDDTNFSVVANGKIITIGDVLDGMKITEIQPNRILLEKEGIKYKIEYNR